MALERRFNSVCFLLGAAHCFQVAADADEDASITKYVAWFAF